MIFNSIEFLIFFPIVICIYFIIPKGQKYIWLLLSSYYFYMNWNPKYIVLILASTISSYFTAILIEKTNNKKKIFVTFGIAFNLCILMFYKYFNFLLDNINRIFEVFQVPIINNKFDVILPVGISFYTFQVIGYIIDVYRKEIYAEKNFLKYALFVSFFPQLVAGPIERSKNLLIQINKEHSFDYLRVKQGLLLILWGVFQKVVIADRVAIIVNQVYNNYADYYGLQIILATIFFAIQIYCDFASYSTIAIGAAKVLGFNLMNNFNSPYFSTSISDFWRRWHISLSTWFRDYLYIPLGGNRVSKSRKHFNIMIIFLASGLWHGASWNYVFWGFLHGLYQIIGDVFRPIRHKIRNSFNINNKLVKIMNVIITFVLVDFAWIFFRAKSFKEGINIIRHVFITSNKSILECIYSLGLNKANLIIIIMAIVILMLVEIFKDRINIIEEITKKNMFFRWSVYYCIIFCIIIFGVYGIGYDQSQFIYFQF